MRGVYTPGDAERRTHDQARHGVWLSRVGRGTRCSQPLSRRSAVLGNGTLVQTGGDL